MNDSALPFENVRNGGQADSNEFMMGLVANGIFELAKIYGHTGEEKVRALWGVRIGESLWAYGG